MYKLITILSEIKTIGNNPLQRLKALLNANKNIIFSSLQFYLEDDESLEGAKFEISNDIVQLVDNDGYEYGFVFSFDKENFKEKGYVFLEWVKINEEKIYIGTYSP